MSVGKVFFAYPSQPSQLGGVIESAAQSLKSANLTAKTWREMDVAGKFIASGVMNELDDADLVVLDITRLNFNVTFEAGYAMGKGKKLLPTVNSSLNPVTKEITQLGLFDSLGYESYQNSSDLAKTVENVISKPGLKLGPYEIDHGAPVYILDTLYKTDASLRIASKVKKTRIKFRSFDPKESSRLSAMEAYRNVAQSVAVIVNLLSSQATDFERNNLRGAFLAGLAFALGKETLIFQDGEEPVPLDYRELVYVYKKPDDIDQRINELAPKIIEALQAKTGKGIVQVQGTLEKLDFGAPAAENEMTHLGEYYVRTDEYNKTMAGSIRLVAGRKGVGKTALFLQVRDKKRQDKSLVVLDLRPEGHQLKRFKAAVLNVLSEAVKEHVATAFWEYSLLLELAYKLLEKDKSRYRRDLELMSRYQSLSQIYESAGRGAGEGDFSERLRQLIDRISNEFEITYGVKGVSHLSVSEVTGLIYKQDISKLRDVLCDYLKEKDEVWILFDNIDKGWPTHGVELSDIVILRALLEATRKIEQYFARKKLTVHTVVFLRNDVFELLVDESPDRGKEAKVSLDWTDPDRLRELLRRRIVHGGLFKNDTSFDSAWSAICVSHVEGNESSEYMIERSLMRPRNLLTLISHAKSNAVNLNHNFIQQDDILKAVRMYSADIGNEIGLEIRDIYPDGVDIPYSFMKSKSWLTVSEIKNLLSTKANLPPEAHNKVIELLLWFSFLGDVSDTNNDVHETFIYDVFYDMKKLRILVGSLENEQKILCIHKAFWPFLNISEH